MTNEPKVLVGLDYSMSGPAITICHGDFHIFNCKMYYMTDIKRYQGVFYNGKIVGHGFKEWKTNEERFDIISDFFIDILSPFDPLTIQMFIKSRL